MKGQWPIDHDGTTPADIPADYSYFPTLFDDHSGYEPSVVEFGIGADGREVILIALSPGRYLSGTLIGQGKVPGQDPSGSSREALAVIDAARRAAKPP